MTLDVKKIGLVQINNSFDQQCYVPYSVGMLQAYAQQHLACADRFEFLLPIFRRIEVREAVAQLIDADLVCFSTYVWNVRLSLAIAAELKKQRPEVVTVFGGPQIPDQGAEGFLRENRCVDLACHGEGERVFKAILEHIDDHNWQAVPSLSYLDQTDRFVQTPLDGRIKAISEVPSPYIAGVFEALIEANPDVQWVGLWETNRGCPFTCAYCDWGSATKNTVVARDMADVYQEVDWFGDHKIEFIFCCDANFSLLTRDLDIVKRVVKVKSRAGYPKALSVQSTKNFTENSYAIYELMGQADLSKGVSLSLQSVYEPTLEAIKRKNIPAETFREAQETLTRMGIETFTDIILPLPEETYESLVDGVVFTIENGQHNRIQFNNLSILPNATMGDPVYQKKYGFDIVETEIINTHGSLTGDNAVAEKQQLVIGTHAMPQADWVRARVFSWMTALLHFNKLLQIPFVLLNSLYRIGYRDILCLFAEEAVSPIFAEIRQFFDAKARAIQKGDVEYCESQKWLNIWWPADELVMIQLCTENKLDQFYREAESCLVELMRDRGICDAEQLLGDATTLNRHLIKMPHQDLDLYLTLSYNVWDVYREALNGQETHLEQSQFNYRIDRTDQIWSSWEDWSRRVIWWGNKRGAYLYDCARVGVAGNSEPGT